MRLLLLAVLVPVVLPGQTSLVTGVVRDPSGTGIPASSITLTKEDSGTRYTARSDAEGRYQAVAVQPGVYKIRIAREGFQTLVRLGVKLEAGGETRIDFTLGLEPVIESLTVEDSHYRPQTGGTALPAVIGRSLIEKLPLGSRGVLALLEIVPGVVVTPAGTGESGQFSAAGQRADANYLVVDGISIDHGVQLGGLPGSPAMSQALGGVIPAFTALGSLQGVAPAQEIEELQVCISATMADAGRTLGGHVALSTRTGGNQIHGTLFEHGRNQALDANNWFANQAGSPRAPFRLHDFGGALGGPLVRNRTFFFAAREDLRITHVSSEREYVPTLRARVDAPPSTAWLLRLLPLPNGPEISPELAAYSASPARWSRASSTGIRLDHNFASGPHLFARFSGAPSADRQQRPGALAESVGSLDFRSITLGLDASAGPHVANSLRINRSWLGHEETVMAGAPELARYFPNWTPSRHTSLGLDVLSLGVAVSNDWALARQRQWNVVDTLSVARGGHLLQFGVDVRRLAPELEAAPYHVRALYADLRALDAGNIAVLTVNQRGPVRVRATNISAFAQDAWKLSPRLTVHYGVRWEFNPPPHADALLLASVDPRDSTVRWAARGGSLWKEGWGNFAPRLGVALRLTRSGRSVLRAAAGAYYDPGFGLALEAAVANRSQSFAGVTPSSPVAEFDAFPESPSLAAASKLAADFRAPLSFQWNTRLEHSPAESTVASLAYLGARDSRLVRRELMPLADLGYADVYTNNGMASYQAVQVQARTRMGQKLEGVASYAWAHSIDNASRARDLFSPGVEWGGMVDRGNSSFDIRHSFSAAVTWTPPGVRGWSLGAIARARSGFPLTVSGLNSYFPPGEATRPDLVMAHPVWIRDGNAAGGARLNPAAFSMPPEMRPGTLGRNSIAGFGMWQTDLSLERQFTLAARLKLACRIEAYNVFNHANFGNPDPFLGNPTFGRSVSMLDRFLGSGGPSNGLAPALQIGGPRSLQVVLRLRF